MLYMVSSTGGDFPDWVQLSHHLGISYKNGDSKCGKKNIFKKYQHYVLCYLKQILKVETKNHS